MQHIVIADEKAHWREVREEYPALKNSTYLDTSSCGLVARSTAEAAHAEQERLMNEGSSRYFFWHEQGMADLREKVAQNLGATGGGLELVASFTVGMAQVAPLLTHRPKVLLVKGDYPTLHAPFKRRGFEPIWFTPDADGAIPMDRLAEVMQRERPQILAISHVQWTTGFRVDLAAIGLLCKAYGAMSAVDVTQSWCSVPVDVHAMGLDVVGASGYKWPLAGFGNGFLYVAETLRAEFREHHGVDHKAPLTGGHSDPVAMVRLSEALDRIELLGQEAISERVNGLCTYAIEALDRAGVKLLNGRDPLHRAGILMIEGDEDRLGQLQSRKVQAALRGAGLRLGIHFYNTRADIDRMVDAISA